MRQEEPEVTLAVAVLERLFDDLCRGTAPRRLAARCDVKEGGVNYWIDVVDDAYGVGETVRQELRRLVK